MTGGYLKAWGCLGLLLLLALPGLAGGPPSSNWGSNPRDPLFAGGSDSGGAPAHGGSDSGGAPAYNGGSDSGGGQGVLDRKTGKLRFLDILSPADLAKMDLVKHPDRAVMARFPNCTKSTVKKPSDDPDLQAKFEPAREDAYQILQRFFHDDELNLLHFLRAYQLNIRIVTSMHLRQLGDATSTDAGNQVQLAIFRDGVSYFQEQAVRLLPPEDLKWLLLKEMLRNAIFNEEMYNKQNANISNTEVEEALRLIFKNDRDGFLASSYAKKLNALHHNVKKGVTGEGPIRGKFLRGEWLYWDGFDLGYIAPWALQFDRDNEAAFDCTLFAKAERTSRSVRHAGRFHSYDVETGERKLDLMDVCPR